MRAGLNRLTGEPLTGWDHCVQSIGVILTTRVGTRVMDRDLGLRDKGLQDRTPTPLNLMRGFGDIATALRKWEPGYRLRKLRLVRAGADGAAAIEMAGTFYPRGHLGDYSASEERTAIISLRARGRGLEIAED